MSKQWVRDLSAIRTIWQLRALQVGDEVIERRIDDGAESSLCLSTAHLVEIAYSVYPEGEPGSSTSRWRLVAWRRPG